MNIALITNGREYFHDSSIHDFSQKRKPTIIRRRNKNDKNLAAQILFLFFFSIFTFLIHIGVHYLRKVFFGSRLENLSSLLSG